MTRNQLIIIITAAIAALLEILDMSIVNVAIPSMMGNLGATLDEISWVSTGYMIANSIILPVAAWFGTRFGRRNYFAGAIAIFTIASFLCGMSPNLLTLVIFRIIQGLSGGALLPTSQTLIQEQFPKDKAPMAMAIFGMVIMIGPALGPTLGGYLTDTFGWRSIFNVNVPVGIVAAALAYSFIEKTDLSTPDMRNQSVDWLGFLLLIFGVGCFQFFLERGQAEGWMNSTIIRISLLTSVISTTLFIAWELRIKNPIMNLRLFNSGQVIGGAFMMLCLGVILYAVTFVLPIFADHVAHLSATQIGILFVPGSIATAMIMPLIGNFSKHFNPRTIIVCGIGLSVLCVYQMAHFTSDTGTDAMILALICRGLGAGMLFIPILSTVIRPFKREQIGQVNGIMNFFRQIGGSIGIAGLSLALTRFGKQIYSDLMPTVTLLNPSTYTEFVAKHAPAGLPPAMGFPSQTDLVRHSMYGRVMTQSFIASFSQLCWVLLIVVSLMLIPILWMKMEKIKKPPVDIH